MAGVLRITAIKMITIDWLIEAQGTQGRLCIARLTGEQLQGQKRETLRQNLYI